jgi:hypothetical protein
MMADAYSTTPARLNRLLLGLVAAAGFALGLLPVWIALDRSNLVGYTAIATIALSLIVPPFLKDSTVAGPAPGARDLIVAALGATFLPVGFGIFWIALHYAFGFAGSVVESFVGWPRSASFDSFARIADYVSAFVLTVGGVQAVLQGTIDHLHLGAEATPPAARRSTHVWLVGLAVAATAIPLAILVLKIAAASPVSLPLALGLMLVMVFGGARLYVIPDRSRRTEVECITALESLLRAAGYDVTRSPTSSVESLTPFVAELALQARHKTSGWSLAIDVKSAAAGEPVPLRAGTNLRLNASALRMTEAAGATVHPVLVIVRGTPEQSLRDFARESGITLVEGVPRSLVIEGLAHPATLSAAAKTFVGGLAPPSMSSAEQPTASGARA